VVDFSVFVTEGVFEKAANGGAASEVVLLFTRNPLENGADVAGGELSFSFGLAAKGVLEPLKRVEPALEPGERLLDFPFCANLIVSFEASKTPGWIVWPGKKLVDP
jgi:hypothetical protein